jgi:cytochrome c oxidase accessory protein FixG
MEQSVTQPTTVIGVETIDVKAVGKRESGKLYQKRAKIHPKRVYGTFRSLKWWVMAATLGIYYVTPWLRWDRGPNAPDQAVLIDFPARRFYFFFIEIWPQEVYYVTGLLIMAAMGLFLVTTVMGRAWCGYTCPQTVWTDLFLVVERFVEGDRNARIKLDRAPLSLIKFSKRTAKFAIWLAIAMGTGGAWVFYFADAPTLAGQLIAFDAPTAAYITIGILTATTFVLGGFAREQVCTYMCPWPRIQGAMVDEDSLIVTYRAYRGEPRGPHKAGESWEDRGHCIDCNQCVAACPAGIDIRDGLQLECISCALCIDACDTVMEKVDLPRGLIGYDTLRNLASRSKADADKTKIFRPRIIVYAAVWLMVGLFMTYVLATRSDLDINVLHDRNPVFVMLSDGSIRNGYTFKILNKAYIGRSFTLTTEGVPNAKLSVVGAADLTRGSAPIFTVGPDRLRSFRVFVAAPGAGLAGETAPIRFVLREVEKDTMATYENIFRGPKR